MNHNIDEAEKQRLLNELDDITTDHERRAEIGDILEIGGTIQLPREGIWEITGYLKAEGLNNTLMEQTFEQQIRVEHPH